MSLFQQLRDQAEHETDPEVKKQRLAKIADLESQVRDLDEQHAALKKKLSKPQSGDRPFFSWTEFVFGLAIVAALVGSFYFGLSSIATIVVVSIVALFVTGLFMLGVNRKIKKIGKKA